MRSSASTRRAAVAARAARVVARRAERVELVDEDDGGRRGARARKDVAQALLALAVSARARCSARARRSSRAPRPRTRARAASCPCRAGRGAASRPRPRARRRRARAQPLGQPGGSTILEERALRRVLADHVAEADRARRRRLREARSEPARRRNDRHRARAVVGVLGEHALEHRRRELQALGDGPAAHPAASTNRAQLALQARELLGEIRVPHLVVAHRRAFER